MSDGKNNSAQGAAQGAQKSSLVLTMISQANTPALGKRKFESVSHEVIEPTSIVSLKSSLQTSNMSYARQRVVMQIEGQEEPISLRPFGLEMMNDDSFKSLEVDRTKPVVLHQVRELVFNGTEYIPVVVGIDKNTYKAISKENIQNKSFVYGEPVVSQRAVAPELRGLSFQLQVGFKEKALASSRRTGVRQAQ